VSNLINGLEDPRIELKVIESGYAPNRRALFEHLTNSVLGKSGVVEANDYKNIPYLLAIEGRRLNGYNINVPSIVDDSPYAVHLHWALQSARVAKNTQRIADIAVELYNRIKEQDKQRKQDEQEEQDDDNGNPTDNPTNPSDKPSDKQGDEEGGEEGDEEGEGGNKPSDKPSNEQGKEEGEEEDGNGSGHGDEGFEGGRDVEPSTFIEGELGKHSSTVDKDAPRPSFGKPRFETFNWR
jgi:hypothetical protein